MKNVALGIAVIVFGSFIMALALIVCAILLAFIIGWAIKEVLVWPYRSMKATAERKITLSLVGTG